MLLAAHHVHGLGHPLRCDRLANNKRLDEVNHEHVRGDDLGKHSIARGASRLPQEHIARPFAEGLLSRLRSGIQLRVFVFRELYVRRVGPGRTPTRPLETAFEQMADSSTKCNGKSLVGWVEWGSIHEA